MILIKQYLTFHNFKINLIFFKMIHFQYFRNAKNIVS